MKKEPIQSVLFISHSFSNKRLSSFNFARLKASGANMKSLGSTVHFAFNRSDIGIPNMIGTSVRVAYVITEMNAFITNITLCHLSTPPCIYLSANALIK